MPGADLEALRNWTRVPAPRFVGGNRVELLEGGEALFPRMRQAIDAAAAEVWLATYIFHDDPAATTIADALNRAAARASAPSPRCRACARCLPAAACGWRSSAR